jgi:hypothetical protein
MRTVLEAFGTAQATRETAQMLSDGRCSRKRVMRSGGADDGLDKLHKLQLRVLPHHAQSIGSVGPCALSRRASLATSTRL